MKNLHKTVMATKVLMPYDINVNISINPAIIDGSEAAISAVESGIALATVPIPANENVASTLVLRSLHDSEEKKSFSSVI